MGATVLLLEDEPSIADTLVYALRTEGFTVEWRLTAAEGWSAVQSLPVDCVLLDVGLPDGNGFEWCRRLRTVSAVPVIFLTAREAEVDRIVGLEIGADDYVTKPFSPREVAARVRAVLRRIQPRDTEIIREDSTAAEWVVDDERKEVRWRGQPLELTRYEYRLLAVLYRRPGRVFSRDELMARVWEDPGASLDRTVDAHVKQVRQKLRLLAPALVDQIVTHRGLGYSWRSASRP